MRIINEVAFSEADPAPLQYGPAIDASNLVNASVQISIIEDSPGTITGKISVEASNDKPPASNLSTAAFTPTNWNLIDGAEVDIDTGDGSVSIIPPLDLCYQYIRVKWAPSYKGTQTITTVADVSGSLNSTYFLYSTPVTEEGEAFFYIWISVDDGGVDPMVPDRTGIKVDIAADTTDQAVAIAIANAAAGTGGDWGVPASSNVITVTFNESGAFTPASDVDTGFAFADTTPQGPMTVNIKAVGF